MSQDQPYGAQYEHSYSSLRSSLHHHPYHEACKGHSSTTDSVLTLVSNVSNFPLTFKCLSLPDTGSPWINPGLSTGQPACTHPCPLGRSWIFQARLNLTPYLSFWVSLQDVSLFGRQKMELGEEGEGWRRGEAGGWGL